MCPLWTFDSYYLPCGGKQYHYWTSLFTTSGSKKLKIQKKNNLNKQTNTMYSIQTKDNNKWCYYGTLIGNPTPGIQWHNFRPLGWPLTGEWAPREALFVKLLWPLVMLICWFWRNKINSWRAQTKSGLSHKNKFPRKSCPKCGLSPLFHWCRHLFSSFYCDLSTKGSQLQPSKCDHFRENDKNLYTDLFAGLK